MVEIAAEFLIKSVMCHSMGNRVLRFLAAPDMKFDNIFMVVADVRDDVLYSIRNTSTRVMMRITGARMHFVSSPCSRMKIARSMLFLMTKI